MRELWSIIFLVRIRDVEVIALANDEKKVQVENYLRFTKWLKSNGKEIKPRRKIALFYAGDYINMGELGKISKKIEGHDNKADQHIHKAYTLVKQMTSNRFGKKEALYSSVDTAVDACPRKPGPILTCPQTGKDEMPGSLRAWIDLATKKSRKPPYLPRKLADRIWPVISSLYARNCDKDIQIIDAGISHSEEFFKKKVLCQREIKELLKNPKLPRSAKNEVRNWVAANLEKYGPRASKMKEALEKAKKEMS